MLDIYCVVSCDPETYRVAHVVEEIRLTLKNFARAKARTGASYLRKYVGKLSGLREKN